MSLETWLCCYSVCDAEAELHIVMAVTSDGMKLGPTERAWSFQGYGRVVKES